MNITITITESAAKEVLSLRESQSLEDAKLRVWVAGGGCSGLSYGMALDPNDPEEDDIVVENNGATIVVDAMSAKYLSGSIIEFDDNMMSGGFRISNPNSVKSCGCGSSFSTDEEGISELNDGKGCGGCGSR